MSNEKTSSGEPKPVPPPFEQGAEELARNKAKASDADRKRLREEHEQNA